MLNKLIMIVDDEKDIRELLEISINSYGVETVSFASMHDALDYLKKNHKKVEICITDLKLQNANGLDLVKLIKKDYSHIATIVITAYGSVDVAIDAIKSGAAEFINKPIDLKNLKNVLSKVANNKNSVDSSYDLLGDSKAISDLQNKITKISHTDAPVYISGESGSGKERVARLIHRLSSRASMPFIAVNCGAIPRELMESEFFGHKKGSFTGAIFDKVGLFQAADGGTLFLDEVGELPLEMQVKLLRVIQEQSIRPVGGTSEIVVNVRILSATHKDLHKLVSIGEFREDLFYRINVIHLHVPSLREHIEDLDVIAKNILSRMNIKYNKIFTLSDKAINKLKEYKFPGNVRELENVLERALSLTDGNIIEESHLEFDNQYDIQSISEHIPVFKFGEDNIDDYIDRFEKKIIREALILSNNNKSKAAKLLGLSILSLEHKIGKNSI